MSEKVTVRELQELLAKANPDAEVKIGVWYGPGSPPWVEYQIYQTRLGGLRRDGTLDDTYVMLLTNEWHRLDEKAQQRIDTLDKCLKEALYQAELEAQRAEAAEAENRRLRSMIMGMLEAPIFKEVERLRAELDQRQSTSTKKRKARVTRHSPGMISIRAKEEE